MSTKPKGQVRVRGTCSKGHTTEATSDPGRVTWEGPCTAEGCELPVKARRVPRDTPAPPPETRVATDADGAGDPYAVHEVTSYDVRTARPAAAFDSDPAGPVAVRTAGQEGRPAGVPGAGAGDKPADGRSGRPDPGPDAGTGRPPGFRERVAARRAQRRTRQESDGAWLVPGVVR